MVIAAFWTTLRAIQYGALYVGGSGDLRLPRVANSTSVARQQAPNQRPGIAIALERVFLIEASKNCRLHFVCEEGLTCSKTAPVS